MKKLIRQNASVSLKDLMDHITTEMYTKQTLASLFRCFLETIIEGKYDSLVLVKVNNVQNFYGLLNRLKYSDSKVYSYSDNLESDNFRNITIDNAGLENDEFLIIVAERFSACLYWDESTTEVFGLSQGFCSLNPYDARQITDYLQSLSFNQQLADDLANIKQDRRHNERFTTILRKLVASLESRQRDLICANTELKELHDKTLQSEKLAAIGQLCSTVAHELRNPLGLIDLYAKIISRNIDSINIDTDNKQVFDSLTNAAATISNASKSLENILTELLDYSKPMSLDKTDDNLEKLISENINLIKPSYEKNGVELVFNFDLDDQIKLKFDRFKLGQALLNIIKNALEVSKSGDTVEISVESSNNSVCIIIKDQGPGIDTDNKEKIFTPYFTTKKEGTGLGLAQSRKILEAHNGSLVISSTGPKGTTFCLTLPVEHLHL